MRLPVALFLLAALPAVAAEPPAAAPAAEPGFARLQLGAYTVVALSDGTFTMPAAQLLIEDRPGIVKTLLGRAGYGDTVPGAVNAFLIDTGDKRVLIDAGGGALLGPGLGQVPAQLRAAGYAPEQIDEIWLTHLHPDHVGGLVHDGQAVYPKAIVRAEDRELAFWLDKTANQPKVDDSVKGAFDGAAASLAPYRASGRVQTFKPGATLLPGIRAVDLAGHTAGHTAYRVTSRGQTLLVWGDTMHVAAVQFADPKVTIHFDSTPAQAEAARARVFAEAARDGEWIAAAHIAFPGLGHVRRDGAAYAWQPLTP